MNETAWYVGLLPYGALAWMFFDAADRRQQAWCTIAAMIWTVVYVTGLLICQEAGRP